MQPPDLDSAITIGKELAEEARVHMLHRALENKNPVDAGIILMVAAVALYAWVKPENWHGEDVKKAWRVVNEAFGMKPDGN